MAINYNNADDLSFAAELIPDKIVYRKEVSYSVPASTTIADYHEYVIPHGLPFIPLVLGTYSDDNYATSYDFGTGPYGYLTTFAQYGFTILAHAWADATNITIRAISHNTTRTLTFHIVGLSKGAISAPTPTIVPTPPVQDDFLFNSDMNTLKHVFLTEKIMTTNGLGTYVFHQYLTYNETVFTPLCFVEEDGKRSLGNTMNTITNSGVAFAVDINTGSPGRLRLGVSSGLIKTVNIIVKAYVDA